MCGGSGGKHGSMSPGCLLVVLSHPDDRPQSLQLALGYHGLNTSAVGSALQVSFSVRHALTPGNSQDEPEEAAYVEAL